MIPQVQAYDPQLYQQQLQTEHQVQAYDPQLYQQQLQTDRQVQAYDPQLYQQQLQTDRQVQAHNPQLYHQQLQTDRQVQVYDPQTDQQAVVVPSHFSQPEPVNHMVQQLQIDHQLQASNPQLDHQQLQTDQQVQAYDPQLYHQQLQTDRLVQAYDPQLHHQQLQTSRQVQAYDPQTDQQTVVVPSQFAQAEPLNHMMPQYYSSPNYQQNSNPPNQYFENSGFNNIDDFSFPPPDDLAFPDVPSPPPLQTTVFDFDGNKLNFPVSDQQCNNICDPNLLLPDCNMYHYNDQQSLQSYFPVDQQQSNYGMNQLSSFQPAGQALNSGYYAPMNTPNCYTNAQFDQPSTLNVIPNSCPSVQINQPSTSDALITRKRTRPPQCEEQEMQRMAKAQRMANAPMNTPNCYTNAQFDQPSTSNAIPNSYASAQINQPSTSDALITRKRTGTPECDPDQEQEMQRMVKAQRRF